MEKNLETAINLDTLKEYKKLISEAVNNLEIMDDSKLMDKFLTTAVSKDDIKFYVDLITKCGDFINIAEAVNDSYKPTKRDKVFKTVKEKDPNHKYSWNINDLKEIKETKINEYNNMLASKGIPMEKGIGVTKTETLFNLMLAQLVKANIRKKYRKTYHMRSSLFGDEQINSNREVEAIFYDDLKRNTFDDEQLHQMYVLASRNVPKAYEHVCDLFIMYKTKFYELLQFAQKTNKNLADILKAGSIPATDSKAMQEILNFGISYDDDMAYLVVLKNYLEKLLEISTEMLNLCADKVLGSKIKFVSLNSSANESDFQYQGKQ